MPLSRLVWRDRALHASDTIHDTPHHLTEHASAASSLLHIAPSRPKLHASDTIHDAPHHWCILHDGQIKALHDSGILGDMGMRQPPGTAPDAPPPPCIRTDHGAHVQRHAATDESTATSRCFAPGVWTRVEREVD